MNILEYMKDHTLYFDGAMGTMIQKENIKTNSLPDLLNITHGDIITGIHKKYVDAGSDCVSTNTFGANRLKLKNATVDEVIKCAIENARKAKPKFIALSVGPIGKLLAPLGTLTKEEAYDIFKEQVLAGKKYGADLIIFETFSDLMELKLAVLCAKENTDLPVFTTMTYQKDGRTFVGVDPVSATITLCGLGVDAVGVNCSLGPNEITSVVDQILANATKPVIVQANAGLPDMDGNYSFDPNVYAECIHDLHNKGVSVVGGCCGTDPSYIKAMCDLIGETKVNIPTPKYTAVTSGQKTVFIGKGIKLIGERINPTGKPKLKTALREQNYDYIVNEAINQKECGADILDVNVGLPEIDESTTLVNAVEKLQACIDCPLQIDSTKADAIEKAVRNYCGKPLINSVNGDKESMEAIFPIAKKYGACVLGLCLDKNGIPETVEGRLEIAKRIVETAKSYGIPKEDILIDTLVLTASAQQKQVMTTINTIKAVKETLGVSTVLGVSNVSFGLPNRELINSVFLSAAFGAGLDAPILNPLSKPVMDTVNVFKVLNCQDENSENYITNYTGQVVANTQTTSEAKDLKTVIIKGLQDESAPIVKELLKTTDKLTIINEYFIPALDVVGKKYEEGKIFLPNLMLSAQTVKNGFDVLDDSDNDNVKQDKILIATVKGDIHDIGKNIVKMLLSNYGYKIIDLGKDVSPLDIVDTIKKEDIRLVGLSALMTTTVANMKETIDLIKENNLDCKIMVGGAVLTPEYAKMVGADFYAKDAKEAVDIANGFFK